MRKLTVSLILIALSLLSILSAKNGLAFSKLMQNYQVEIWTNQGSQGTCSEQSCGSYSIGDSITLYIQSSVNGNAMVCVSYGSLTSSCNEIGEYKLTAYQTVPIGPNTVGSPSGQHYFFLQVCPSSEEYVPQQSSCNDQVWDYTWIDVAGSPPPPTPGCTSVTTTSTTTATSITTSVTTAITTTTITIPVDLTFPQMIVTVAATATMVAMASRVYMRRKHGTIRISQKRTSGRPGLAFDLEVKSGVDREESKLTHEEYSTVGAESQPHDLEELIRSQPSREGIQERIQRPDWLSTFSKEAVEEFLIDRILDNLSALIPEAVVELTAESQLTEDQISQRKECMEAVKNQRREFTFELEKKNLPAFHPWVEFTPKLAGLGVAKLRFEYLAQPEIAAKDVKVVLLNGHLSEASIGSLDASIDMSMIVNGQPPVKLGTIQRTLSLNQKSMFHINPPPEAQTPIAPTASKFCISCGAKIPITADYCGSCGVKQT